MSTTKRLPTLFIPHGGGPCFFMDPPPSDPHMWEGLAQYLRGIDASLGVRPKAVLVISGHWENPLPTLNVAAKPGLLFDYYGFPEHTYRLKYPAAGAPELAERVRALLKSAGIDSEVESRRGFDHGVFVPFLLIYPDADVPILQLSLQGGLDPGTHLAIGKALAPLRDQGVLIVGSGMSYHNLADMFSGRGREASEAFDEWLGRAVEDPAQRDRLLEGWHDAPGGAASHPREEHLIPLMVAAGAAEGDAGRRTFGEAIRGNRISGFQFG
ncbi:MAG TPA: class III extradiol ring-cleavage dioxygenase [Steroidobacteraceae bacterium]|nr:class III extradiol ring-cleavage dioxygenase [Steroidobacteraceae bacterium]